jgi:hypothetical protein
MMEWSADFSPHLRINKPSGLKSALLLSPPDALECFFLKAG